MPSAFHWHMYMEVVRRCELPLVLDCGSSPGPWMETDNVVLLLFDETSCRPLHWIAPRVLTTSINAEVSHDL